MFYYMCKVNIKVIWRKNSFFSARLLINTLALKCRKLNWSALSIIYFEMQVFWGNVFWWHNWNDKKVSWTHTKEFCYNGNQHYASFIKKILPWKRNYNCTKQCAYWHNEDRRFTKPNAWHLVLFSLLYDQTKAGDGWPQLHRGTTEKKVYFKNI